MKEHKHYELRSTRKPMRHARLASTVTVIDEDGNPGYGYLSFSETFVAALGRELPMGISSDDPAHLHVFFDTRRKLWSINVRYVRDHRSVIELWTVPHKPDWLTIFKMPKGPTNGNPSTSRG